MTLLSTAYLPSVYYMAWVAQHDVVTIEHHETFPKQTFRNRAVIATGNGLQTLTVPIIHAEGNHTRTEDIGVSYHEPWNIRHFRAIVTAYNAAPYFLYYRDGIERLMMQRYDRLVALNDALLSHLMKKMKINTQVDYSTDFLPKTEPDLRDTLTDKHSIDAFSLPPYSQVFDTRFGFQGNLSVLDLLFNLGPEAHDYLMNVTLEG